ncbi:MAG: hypothetical protein ABTQ25_17715 [Nitrosomonas ureae]
MNADQGKLKAIGTVYALSEAHRRGQVRLFDNRRVQFDFSVIGIGSRLPKLKDEVDIEAIGTPDGLVASFLAVREPDSNEAPLHDAAGGKEQTEPTGDAQGWDGVPRYRLPFTEVVGDTTELGNPEQKFYEQAAVARTEGRFADARHLFEKAIDAGGEASIYTAYFKMLTEGAAKDIQKARELMKRALLAHPHNADFYVMFGHMERRANNLPNAEEILRKALGRFPAHTLIRTGLAQVLSQIGTVQSLKEAGSIFHQLESAHKLNKSDRTYMRFRALTANPRAGRVYSFLDKLAGFSPAVPGRKELPVGVSDLVVDIKDPALESSFGIAGTYLIRCFSVNPKRSDVLELSRYLRSLKADASIGLINGRDVLLSSSLAFVAIPRAAAVRDFLMSVLSENNEAILPIDDQLLGTGLKSKERLQELFSQYLGVRDLYDSTLPVSGRRLFGRERLLVRLADQAHKGEFIGIFGLRKMGKTSLMYQLRDEKLKDEAVAYVDLQASPGLPIGSFLPVLWEIERDLLERLAPRFPRINAILRLGRFSRYSDAVLSGVSPALLFSEDMRELLDAIIAKKLAGVSRLIIILDELERCLPLAGQPAMAGYLEFFALLRGLAQTDRYRGAISSVVVAANASISEKGYWEGRENPVFSLYKTLFLPPLSKPDTTQMIQNLGKGMSVYWEPAAIDEMFTECGGHPYLTRVLCSQISKKYMQRPLQINEHMVRTEIPIFIQEKSDKFAQITELLHAHFPDEEKFLDRLAVGGQPENPSDESIRHLIGYQLISREGNNQYRISLNALNSWLRRRAGA